MVLSISDLSTTPGCGNTRVHVYLKGGVVPERLSLPWTACEWARRVDEYSTAAIELQGIDCFAVYEFIRPRAHELVIERQGSDGIWRRVWAGPIYGVSHTPEYPGLRVSAHDVSWWLKRRKFHFDHNWRMGTDLTTVFVESVDDGLSVDNSFGLVVDSKLSGVRVDEDDGRKVVAASNQYVYGYIESLGQTALDWTVVDRVLTVRGFEIQSQALNPLTERHLVLPTQFTITAEMAPSRITQVGQGRGEAGDTVVGTAVTSDPSAEATYGVMEAIYTDSTIRDVTTAITSARTRMANFNGVPKWVFHGGDLDQLRSPFTMDDLVPGRRIPIAIGQTGRYPTINEVYRLTAVDAYVGPEQNKLSISVGPLGATDENTEEA